jgi:hypothetical protein
MGQSLTAKKFSREGGYYCTMIVVIFEDTWDMRL